MRISRLYITFLLFFLLPCSLLAQDTSATESSSATALREELQSYMGYEENLAARYLTLPYDTAVSNNRQSKLVDVGLLFALFLPFLYLWSRRERWEVRLGVLLLLFLYLGLLSHYSKLIRPDGVLVDSSPENLQQFQAEVPLAESFWSGLTAQFYEWGQIWGSPLKNGLESISGPADALSYPLLILIFAGISVLLHRRLVGAGPGLKSTVFVLAIYGLFWWLFSGGIIWYGFLLIPVLYLFVAHFMIRHSAPAVPRAGRYAFFGAAALWGVLALALFISNLNYRTDSGKDMIDSAVLLNLMGHYDHEQVVDAYYPGVSRAMQQVNADEEALVYRAGSMLTFLIDKNDRRVFEDNLLDFFNQMHNRFGGDKATINRAFRQAGFRYLIIGLRIGSSDRTPEGTLRKKFETFMNYLYQNPELELLATDNQVKAVNPQTGQQEIQRRVFGATQQLGTFAVFRIN